MDWARSGWVGTCSGGDDHLQRDRPLRAPVRRVAPAAILDVHPGDVEQACRGDRESEEEPKEPRLCWGAGPLCPSSLPLFLDRAVERRQVDRPELLKLSSAVTLLVTGHGPLGSTESAGAPTAKMRPFAYCIAFWCDSTQSTTWLMGVKHFV